MARASLVKAAGAGSLSTSGRRSVKIRRARLLQGSLFGGLLAGALLPGFGCSSGDSSPKGPASIKYAEMGSLSAPSGQGSFRFGAASADTQIEENNIHSDWWVWSSPKAEGGLGQGKDPVGEGSRGFSKAIEDIQLLKAMNLDTYRFSMSWARIEPERDQINEEALEHYGKFIDALIAAGIKPTVTLHHFSNPVWIDDPRDTECEAGPTSANLCGFGHPEGGALVVEEMRQHAQLLAERFGDRVDDWATLNEPVNYLLASHGIGQFPPGKSKIFRLLDNFVPVIRDYVSAHAEMYLALKEFDTVDADQDGVNASVGLTLNVGEWVPSRDNQLSDDPEDVAAAKRVEYVYHHLLVDALRTGRFDANLDGEADEDQPRWKNTLDWLGVQYYFRGGISAKNGLLPAPMSLTPCFGTFDFGSCVLPEDPTWCVPTMTYEYYAAGLGNVLKDFSKRWPGLPLVVTESGLATEVGERRAQHIVRALEQIEVARKDGADVRGYYYWSLTDNFEWSEGYAPRFGLYRVDYNTYERTPTIGAEVLGEIALKRELPKALREAYGGVGPMVPEGDFGPRQLCNGKELP